MKIKLKNPQPAAPAEAPANGASSSASAPLPAAPGPKLALKIKSFTPAAAESTEGAPTEAPKAKRKYTKKAKVDENGQPVPGAKPGPKPKKRPLEDGEAVSPVAKRKPKPTAKSLALVHESDDDDELGDIVMEAPVPRPARPGINRTQSVKLSFKPKGATSTGAGAPPQRTGTAILKVKGAGKPPYRPPGVGYDSEAEEAENDPAIESQFILRMVPGPDCSLLRKAIADKTIGKSVSQGGPGVYFRFFDREGRRAMVTIQGRSYAASMVELPCVIESLKSWNKKDWVKTADVCQMLLVLGPVTNEEEAKKYPRPRDVEPDSHRFAHGLTPPMQWVRKRRFRPRKSYLDVERIENQTEALLEADDNADECKHELVDSEAESGDESSSDEDAEGEDEDEEMVEAPEYVETPAAEDRVDVVELEQMLQAQFEDMDGELFGDGDAVIEVETPVTAHDVAMHTLGQHAQVVLEPESAASTPGAATSTDDNDDDDDDAESDEDAEIDEAAAQRQQQIEELKERIRELETTIEESTAKRDASNNVPFKKKLQARIDQQEADKQVKISQLEQLEEQGG